MEERIILFKIYIRKIRPMIEKNINQENVIKCAKEIQEV